MKNSTFAKRLAEAMKIRELTQTDLHERTGINKSSISTYLRGDYKAKQDKVDLLSSALNVSPAWLMGFDVPMTPNTDNEKVNISSIKNIVPIEKRMIPVIGTIAAGKPIIADEHIETYVPCDIDIHADFGLIVHGDSMIDAGIYDGDIVFIKEQPVVEEGQIAAVRIDDDATLKRFYKTEDGCMLISANPKYAPMHFSAENCDTVQIIGLAVAKYSVIKQ
ncbi:MAG TPA: repressor LexA [Dialister sp.]|nr:repressor LexA [Dialister sp.]